MVCMYKAESSIGCFLALPIGCFASRIYLFILVDYDCMAFWESPRNVTLPLAFLTDTCGLSLIDLMNEFICILKDDW